MTTVFIPSDPAGARRLRDEGSWIDVAGFAATDALRTAADLGPSDDEQADFVAQTNASLQALLDGTGPRVVIAVDADELRVDGQSPYGRVSVPRCAWRDVLAVFVDESEAGPALARARDAIAAADPAEDALGAVSALDEVTTLLDEHALLWYLPSEVDDLPL